MGVVTLGMAGLTLRMVSLTLGMEVVTLRMEIATLEVDGLIVGMAGPALGMAGVALGMEDAALGVAGLTLGTADLILGTATLGFSTPAEEQRPRQVMERPWERRCLGRIHRQPRVPAQPRAPGTAPGAPFMSPCLWKDGRPRTPGWRREFQREFQRQAAYLRCQGSLEKHFPGRGAVPPPGCWGSTCQPGGISSLSSYKTLRGNISLVPRCLWDERSLFPTDVLFR
ncbi:uncharacterized protein LOC119695214 [Motacilla alba alba]|uniref:uncharacterized protein LOC119695214 n=1 Tax=Motacilla alba alba TaxID=1094192 RepID=UPI0018D59452|nr:uncharacterized protein LOC119695214 [Motacilla alba alba]